MSVQSPDPSYEPRGGSRNLTHRDADWSGLQILVAGLGVSGFAAVVVPTSMPPSAFQYVGSPSHPFIVPSKMD